MKLRPVQESGTPAYPTRDEFRAEGNLLERLRPRGWRFSKEAAGAVSVLLAANLAGCGDSPFEPSPPKDIFSKMTASVETAEAPRALAPDAQAVVAPVFDHGEGRGATGCVVVSPPVFLTEYEAMQVIREELAKHDVELAAGGPLRDVYIPARHHRWRRSTRPGAAATGSRSTQLQLDGIDPLHKIGVEFISREEYAELGGVVSNSSVQLYDFKEVAKYLTEQIWRQGKWKVYVGLFYDPQERLEFERPTTKDPYHNRVVWTNAQHRTKEKSKALLRQQAQDFVAWLKQQSVI